MEFVVAIIAIMGLSISSITAIVLFFKTRHRERLALIKYDKDATVFNKEKYPGKSTLKWALVMMGAGAGIMVGFLIDSIFNTEPGGTFASLIFFGGAGLFLYYSHMRRYVETMEKEITDEEYI